MAGILFLTHLKRHYIKHVLSFITIFKTLYTLIWALPWVKNRWKFSSDAKKIPYGISVQEKVVKKDINGEYSGSHSIRTSEGSLYKSLGKKSSKKFYSTSKYAPLHDEEVLDTGENKQVFRISYHKEHKHRVSQKDQSQSFVSQGIYSSPLAIPTDGNERYPKIAGKHGFKAVKKSKVSKFFKKIVCFPCFPKKKTYLDSENSKNMHLFSHAMSPIMSPIMLPTISPLPLSPVSLSSLNDEQKVKELPQKKYDYLFMGNIWVPGQDGFGLVIELSDWISDKLSIRTRQRLANELKRSISTHDKPGYIYVFNLQSSDKIKPYSLEKMFIKIGRASNIQRKANYRKMGNVFIYCIWKNLKKTKC
ncbi:hypothetical protein PORY_000948 [Pneumocystis oryctolagi]|uniref:Uncharacterized protein n=1 Tax=Pneumocystis oryctolagi TaxID=42067 RepID=A0ACB7CE86_9ASCO|nr:hypothetical protein PORY_000948 [Pneumocystis oryctolagi]